MHELPKDIRKLVFTSDFLKIDDRARNRLLSPQNINIDWISALFTQPILELLPGLSVEQFYGDEGQYNSIRWKAYSDYGLPIESASWAALYDGPGDLPEYLANTLSDTLTGALCLTFEAPPYLLTTLDALSVPYIDVAIHPVRYLPDYLFGYRTNVDSVRTRLELFRLQESRLRDFARISSARTARIFRHNLPPEGSAIFFGQIEVDASLIVDGRIASTADVETALFELSATHDSVYYKPHPHVKNTDSLKKLVERLPGCKWIEVNAYDALAAKCFSTVATLSSGTAVEARYFGKNARRFLSNYNPFSSDVGNPLVYTPVYATSLSQEFWAHLLMNRKPSSPPAVPDPFENGVKFSLNMKWGR